MSEKKNRSTQIQNSSIAYELPEHGIWLEDLDLTKVIQGTGQAQKARTIDQKPLTLNGVAYPHGVGTHTISQMVIDLGKERRALRFSAVAGIDDETRGEGLARFEVWLDGKKRFDSGPLRGNSRAKKVEVNLEGARRLVLIVDADGEGIGMGHADWANALLLFKPGSKIRPRCLSLRAGPSQARVASGGSSFPAIHGPRVVGTTPGRPFLFKIPATGRGPLRFSAENLPDGLRLDGSAGIISGSTRKAGKTVVKLRAAGKMGECSRSLVLVAGRNKLALTPPMGWNSWNVWGEAVDEEKVRQAVDWMVKSGLADHGFQTINIDDCWQGSRDKNGRIHPNKKFPNLEKLAGYAHGRGLKLGIYSSPGPQTCAGFEGSYGHENEDARTYAGWGMDFLKHDWCSYEGKLRKRTKAEREKPYRLMRRALDRINRDIVYSICQYGPGQVWKWGKKAGGNSWRTTGDITDTWGSMSGTGFSQNGLEKHAGPGHWNDPDMLVLGRLGWGPNLRPTRLTQDEQVTHMTLWCILAAPLLIGCDLTRLDPFTLALLTNDEVLDVDQDPLGKQGRRISRQGDLECWSRLLWDGTRAVGLFNRGPRSSSIKIDFRLVGLEGGQPVRDLWLRKDRGIHRGSFGAKVPGHGAVFVKIGKPRPERQ